MAGTSDGFMRTLNELVREEGVKGLLRGWTPAYWRLGPHAMLTFPVVTIMFVCINMSG